MYSQRSQWPHRRARITGSQKQLDRPISEITNQLQNGKWLQSDAKTKAGGGSQDPSRPLGRRTAFSTTFCTSLGSFLEPFGSLWPPQVSKKKAQASHMGRGREGSKQESERERGKRDKREREREREASACAGNSERDAPPRARAAPACTSHIPHRPRSLRGGKSGAARRA